MQQSRLEKLRQISCSIFRDLPLTSGPRNGHRILLSPLEGPQIKCHWPNKTADVKNWSSRPVSSEIPINSKLCNKYVEDISKSQKILPVGLHHVYRESIAEWRRKRGGALKKGSCGDLKFKFMVLGETKVTKTNMGGKLK